MKAGEIVAEPLLVIHKGEQFYIPFEVLVGTEKATPENVDGMRMKVDDRLCQWPDGELEYDSEDGDWIYPLTEAQSLELQAGERRGQIAVKIGETILKTDVFSVTVKESTILERWN